MGPRTAAEIKFEVSQQAALRALQQLENKMTSVLGQINKGVSGGAKSAEKMDRSLGRMVGTMKTAALAALGIGSGFQLANTAIGLFRRELEAADAVMKRQQERQLSTSDALKRISRIISKDADISLPTIEKEVIATARETGIDTSKLLLAAEGAISAGAEPTETGQRIRAAFDLAKVAPDLFKTDPEAAKEFTIGIIKQMEEFGVSSREAIGSAFTALSQAQIVELGQAGKNLLAGSAKLKGFGFTQRDALALIAGVSTRTGDVEGNITQTGVIKLMKQLSDKVLRVSGERKEGAELIDFVRADTKEAKLIREELIGLFDVSKEQMAQLSEFERGKLGAGDVAGRAKNFVAFMELISPQASARAGGRGAFDLFQTGRREIKVGDEAEEDVQRREREFKKTRGAALAEAKRRIEGAKIALEEGGSGAIRSLVLESIPELAMAAGGSKFAADIEKLRVRHGGIGQDQGRLLRILAKRTEDQIPDIAQAGAKFLRKHGVELPEDVQGLADAVRKHPGKPGALDRALRFQDFLPERHAEQIQALRDLNMQLRVLAQRIDQQQAQSARERIERAAGNAPQNDAVADPPNGGGDK